MKTFLFIVLVFNSTFLIAQKKKNRFDISSNAEARVLVMKAVGNNMLSKDFGAFYGFGFGGQLMTPIQFGLSLDYNLLFGDAKYGRENFVGNLGSHQLSNIDFSIVHRNEIIEDFSIEEFAGISFYRLRSTVYPSHQKYTEGQGGFNIGAKALYNLDREGIQQFVFGAKGNAYFSGTNNENKDVQKYYRKSFFLGFTFGYRYNF